MNDKELKAQIVCIIREMSVEPEEQCDKIADEIIGFLRLLPATPLVGVDEKTIGQVILNVPCPKGLGQFIATKEGLEYLESIERAIIAKFGSPQKAQEDDDEGPFALYEAVIEYRKNHPEEEPNSPSPDLEKVLEEFDKKFIPSVFYPDEDYRDFIRAHWPKPDPRFVEVGRIEFPEKHTIYGTHEAEYKKQFTLNELNHQVNAMRDACQAAVEAAGVEYGLDEADIKNIRFIRDLIDNMIYKGHIILHEEKAPMIKALDNVIKLAERELITRKEK